MVDVQTVSIAIASASVTVAAFYYVWQIRHQSKLRQTDLVINLSSEFKSKEFMEAFVNVYEAEFRDYDDFVKKYGKLFSTDKVPMSFMVMGNFFEQVGVLLRNNLIEPSLINQLVPVSMVWEKMKPFIADVRKEYQEPRLWEWFEYLYNEMQKREQKLQQSKA
jgi:hypothetical protein